MNFSQKIIFGYYKEPLVSLKITLGNFLFLTNTDDLTARIYQTEPRKLSPNERNITLMYIGGLSVDFIARTTNKSYKTISAHKRNAMKKMGISTNIELMQISGGILLANRLNLMYEQKISSNVVNSKVVPVDIISINIAI